MVLDLLSNAGLYKSISPRIKKALEFIESSDLENLPPGKHEIEGDSVYVIINEYETMDPAASKPEAHRRYIDVQYIVSGSERIGFAPLYNQLIEKEYDDREDYALYSAEQEFFTLHRGMFAIFFPWDLHQPGLTVYKPEKVKKAVIKVLI